MTSTIKVDTISENTSANGVTIDGLTIKDGNIIGDVALAGTTPTFTIGDAGAEDAALIFDGNAQDFYIALDDSADDLIIGLGAAVGTTPMLSFTEAKAAAFTGAVSMATTLTLTGNADFNGDLDVDGTTNLDVVDIDGALTQDGGAVFNEAGADIDFRVESNGNANMLFVDGGNNRIGVGTASPSRLIDVVTSANSPTMEIRSSVTPNGSKIGGGLLLSLNQANDSGSGANDTQAGDILGRIVYQGQGTDYTYNGAEISTIVTVGDGSDGRVPQATALVFKTIAVGGDSSAERCRISEAGIHIGGTGAANALDDYEEGTWTMGISDGTNTATLTGSGYNTGKYIKVGSKVYVQGFLDVQAIGDCSGNLKLTGLPFTAANAPNAYGAVLFGYGAGLSITAGTNLAGYVEGNNTLIELRTWDATTGTTPLQHSELSTGEFIFSATYYV